VVKKRSIVLFFIFLFVSITAFAQETFTILHWNDFHSQNISFVKTGEDKIYVGGYATFAGYIDSIKQHIKNVAIVHAGDDFQGTPISTITKGFSQIDILNIIHPDVFTLGNHEFDYGKDNLYKAIEKANFTIISANIFDHQKEKLFVKPYSIKRYDNIQVGFIGLQTTELPEITFSQNVEQITILNPEEVVRKYVTMINDSVDIIVIVSHMGIDADKELALAVDGYHIIIGGHSHTALFEPLEINNVIICQAGSRGQYMGRLDLSVDIENDSIVAHHGELIETIVGKVTPNEQVQEMVDDYEKRLDSFMNEVIGYLDTDWIRVHRGESNVGNWQADVIREYAGTDIAFQNSGGIRKDIPAGKVTIRDMWELNPFSNHFVVFNVTGSELKKAIEKNCDGKGEFLQISGLKYRFKKSNAQGNRIVDIFVNGKTVSDDSTYSVATNNFLAGNLDYAFGISSEGKNITDLPQIDRDVFIEAIKKQNNIKSEIEHRILEIDEE